MEEPPLELPELIRRETVQVLGRRVDILGIDRSGAYQHYNALLERGFPFPAYNLAIPDFIRRSVPRLRSYHVIGSGLGTLPLLLAGAGLASVGVERDEPRHLTATAIMHGLAPKISGIEFNCRMIGAEFPAAVADIDVSDSMAIVTDFVSTQSPAVYAELCRGLARYRYVLLDLQRFCRKRESAAEWDGLIAELSGYGLAATPESIDLGVEGCYRLFDGQGAARREDMTRQRVDIREARSDAQGAAVPAASPAPRDIAAAGVTVAMLPPRPRSARRRRFGGLAGIAALVVVGIPTLLGIVYYGFIATGQYVTNFEFAVRGPDVEAQHHSLGLSGTSAMTPDAFIVSDYINSPQAARDVAPLVDPQTIFSRPDADFAARLPSNASDDELDDYWRRMVNARFDIVSGNVAVSVRAFSARDSLDLANGVIAASNAMFSKLNQDSARDFVKLADDNLSRSGKELDRLRAAMRAFRAQHGLLQPDKVVMANSTLADDLRRELTGLKTQYAALIASSPRSPTVEILKARIAAVEAAVRKSGSPLYPDITQTVSPADLEQYESLDAQSQTAAKLYGEALELRQKAYLAASSQQSYLALFVKPRLAHAPSYPHRIESIVIVFLAAAAAWFVGLMVVYAVRDHFA